ncbi:MAG: hypothetical protein QOE70_3783 [Chthoniobacter sp.]|jgi:uncharacterized membrane protein|nr:hypothetical protein [Chthoniobacter sp.]
MKAREFLAQLDEPKIVAEIAQAEQGTSGEIRVFVSQREVDDVVARAQRRFEKLGMTRTALRNGVLLYFAPRSRKFAIVGDLGIHEQCGPAFWEEVSTEVRAHLRTEHFTEAIIHGVRKVGEVLARHFPAQAGDRDELSNEIARD